MNNCACCCTNTLNLCKADVCGDGVDFGITAQIPGVHKLIVYFLSMRIVIEEEFVIGQQMIFPVSDLNENYQFTGEIYDPLGSRVLIRKNNVDYDCFRFRTTIAVTLNQVVVS